MTDLNLEALSREHKELQRMAEAGIAIVPDAKFLSNFVQLQRCFRGWKQGTLASYANVSLSTVQRVERGETVSDRCLDQIAQALGQRPGAFTEPRVPLTAKQLTEEVDEWSKQFRETLPVRVEPLRRQFQVIKLTRAHLCLVENGAIGDQFSKEVDGLREALDCVAFILGSEEPNSVFRFAEKERCKRRELYMAVLNHSRGIERSANAVALAGVYDAETNHPYLPKASAGVIAFFPLCSDPGAVKRRMLFGPKVVDLKGAMEAFVNGGVHVRRLNRP